MPPKPAPTAPLSLDPDRHLKINSIIVGVGRDHGVQPIDPCHPLSQSGPGQHPAGPILHLDVVVIFGPIIANKKHSASSSTSINMAVASREIPAT
jgi:hypothetical protein